VGEDGKPVGDGGKKPDAGAGGKGIMIVPDSGPAKGVVLIGGEADVVHESITAPAMTGIKIAPEPPAPRKGIFDGAIDKVLGRV
jgi:hypothetical protein